MKIGDTSILEILLKPFLKFKMMSEYFGGDIRNVVAYEHTYSPAVIMLMVSWAPFAVRLDVWIILLYAHVIIKEIVLDWLIRKRSFNWPDMILRCVAIIIAAIGLI